MDAYSFRFVSLERIRCEIWDEDGCLMNLNGLNMEYLAHHILKQSAILERIRTPEQNRAGRSPEGRWRFAPSRVEDCLIPDRLIPDTCSPHSPSPIHEIPEAKRSGTIHFAFKCENERGEARHCPDNPRSVASGTLRGTPNHPPFTIHLSL